jgi:uncharacterized protein YprB with RNaseH-like and TPR domain
MKLMNKGPRVLLFDIETAPILGYVWGLFDQNVGLNQIHKDWHVLSWCAKWLGDSKIHYMDQSAAKIIEDDKKILRGIWKLLDEADIVVTQNGKSFDVKKLNARFIIHGFQPPSSFKHIDTLRLAKKHFGFTSNKLEYMTNKLNKNYKKLAHKKFAGFELWKECLAGNKAAWAEMKKYNMYDVLSLEELYKTLIPWDSVVNFNVYTEGELNMCKCGSTSFQKRGFYFTDVAKFQKHRCNNCGAETRSKINELTKTKVASLRPGTKR